MVSVSYSPVFCRGRPRAKIAWLALPAFRSGGGVMYHCLLLQDNMGVSARAITHNAPLCRHEGSCTIVASASGAGGLVPQVPLRYAVPAVPLPPPPHPLPPPLCCLPPAPCFCTGTRALLRSPAITCIAHAPVCSANPLGLPPSSALWAMCRGRSGQLPLGLLLRAAGVATGDTNALLPGAS